MSDHYGDESQSASDQDDMVSETDLDADIDQSAAEEMQFTNENRSSSIIPATDVDPFNDTTVHDQYANYSSTDSEPLRSGCILVCMSLMLFLSAFVLLICFPLYIQQLNVNDNGASQHNAYGALLYVFSVISLAFLMAIVIASWCLKLDVKWYKLPLPWNRLTLISTICGVATTICVLSSYQRVSCHLQDPLKGFSLAFSVLFYFFFCKRVMGLRKLFAAATAIVGLFISVDYGLCDRFRCRGVDVPTTGNTTPVSVGWQGRSVWTIVYIIGVALWTLQFSLLEGDIVASSKRANTMPRMNLLTTVSRIVSNATAKLPIQPSPKTFIPKPNALHVSLWIHALALLVAIPFGWIDVIPGSGSITSIDEFFTTTSHTFQCHLNIQCKEVPDQSHANHTLDFLSNLTPASALYNETVRRLRRHRRNAFHQNSALTPLGLSAIASNQLTNLTDYSRHNRLAFLLNTAPHRRTNETAYSQKAHMNRYWTKYKSYMHNRQKVAALVASSHKTHTANQTPTKVAQLILNTIPSMNGDKCLSLAQYALLLSVVYVLFAMSTFHFLFLTESAVFTMTVMSAALPVCGIFWSLFELTTRSGVATIIWAPEITGELICSLLGTPIVILGIVLFGSSHLADLKNRNGDGHNRYTSLSSSTSSLGES